MCLIGYYFLWYTRWMFWTDTNPTYPKISAAWMNGENRTVLVNSRLGKPTGITIDYWMGDRIYWCDNKENLIESMKPDGSDRTIVVSSGRFMFPFSSE